MSRETEMNRPPERRFFFERGGVTGIFYLPGWRQKEFITASILDMSEDDLCLSVHQNDEDHTLHGGDQLTLIDITGSDEFSCLTNLEMEVTWTLKVNDLVAGCEFLNVSPDLRTQIQQLVYSEGASERV